MAKALGPQHPGSSVGSRAEADPVCSSRGLLPAPSCAACGAAGSAQPSHLVQGLQLQAVEA